ncbi:uncharacterized protein LOC123621043 [Lemur catta]|uniref:uncharacterized protein LOC123621043 n=1 Tax=Lemur catta TaxID=9447 RepID=UPI001E2680F3|nr:uncharacterized protein LOC123621043 [Lemur catta]
MGGGPGRVRPECGGQQMGPAGLGDGPQLVDVAGRWAQGEVLGLQPESLSSTRRPRLLAPGVGSPPALPRLRSCSLRALVGAAAQDGTGEAGAGGRRPVVLQPHRPLPPLLPGPCVAAVAGPAHCGVGRRPCRRDPTRGSRRTISGARELLGQRPGQVRLPLRLPLRLRGSPVCEPSWRYLNTLTGRAGVCKLLSVFFYTLQFPRTRTDRVTAPRTGAGPTPAFGTRLHRARSPVRGLGPAAPAQRGHPSSDPHPGRARGHGSPCTGVTVTGEGLANRLAILSSSARQNLIKHPPSPGFGPRPEWWCPDRGGTASCRCRAGAWGGPQGTALVWVWDTQHSLRLGRADWVRGRVGAGEDTSNHTAGQKILDKSFLTRSRGTKTTATPTLWLWERGNAGGCERPGVLPWGLWGRHPSAAPGVNAQPARAHICRLCPGREASSSGHALGPSKSQRLAVVECSPDSPGCGVSQDTEKVNTEGLARRTRTSRGAQRGSHMAPSPLEGQRRPPRLWP